MKKGINVFWNIVDMFYFLSLWLSLYIKSKQQLIWLYWQLYGTNRENPQGNILIYFRLLCKEICQLGKLQERQIDSFSQVVYNHLRKNDGDSQIISIATRRKNESRQSRKKRSACFLHAKKRNWRIRIWVAIFAQSFIIVGSIKRSRMRRIKTNSSMLVAH